MHPPLRQRRGIGPWHCLPQWLGRWNRGLGWWNAGSSKEMGAQAVTRGEGYSGESRVKGGGAEDSSGETGGSGGRTVALYGGTVDSGSAAGILDRQPQGT